ncbi:hypothetical protein F8388_027038 [Cannabis sativa]|uniref:Uncharacterized protein n=1 Tax=Cannabis sativa TaxID=3483 RepID=A0A7J6FNX3_CANSA|nr:hypothetical protein F8388_027038 [Cannabis sativa]
MGKRGGARRVANSSFGSNNVITLREETTGKKHHHKKGGSSSTNVKHLLKVEHLEKLAVLTGGRFLCLPWLRSLAEDWLLLGSLWVFLLTLLCFLAGDVKQFFSLASIAQLELRKIMQRHGEEEFHGRYSKGHLKQICPPKVKTTEKSKTPKSNSLNPSSLKEAGEGKDGVENSGEPDLLPLPATSEKFPISHSPATPVVKTVTTLLEAKKRKRNRSVNKKQSESESSSNPTNGEKSITVSSKRRKKSWTTLKEIADSKDQAKNQEIADLPIPFLL